MSHVTTRRAGSVVVVLVALMLRVPVYAHGDVMRIGSTQSGGGQLRIEPEFDFDLPVVLSEGTMVEEQTIYSSIFPSFSWVSEASPAEGLFPLTESVTVRIAIASPIDPVASVRIKGRIINDPGDLATLGTFDPDPEAHEHPEWTLILDNGVTGAYPISFVLSTTTAGYTASPVYTLMLTNVESETTATATPTTTPTPTPTGTIGEEIPSATATFAATATATASSTPTLSGEATPTVTETPAAPDTPSATATPTLGGPACAGDCNGDGAVGVDELVRIVALGAGNEVEACVAADRNEDETIGIDEVVWSVRSALDGCGQATAG
jgi:hypothetical protein